MLIRRRLNYEEKYRQFRFKTFVEYIFLFFLLMQGMKNFDFIESFLF